MIKAVTETKADDPCRRFDFAHFAICQDLPASRQLQCSASARRPAGRMVEACPMADLQAARRAWVELVTAAGGTFLPRAWESAKGACQLFVP